jgi:hypothetical protein
MCENCDIAKTLRAATSAHELMHMNDFDFEKWMQNKGSSSWVVPEAQFPATPIIYSCPTCGPQPGGPGSVPLNETDKNCFRCGRTDIQKS